MNNILTELSIVFSTATKTNNFYYSSQGENDDLLATLKERGKLGLYTDLIKLDPEISNIDGYLTLYNNLSFNKMITENLKNADGIYFALLDIEQQIKFNFKKQRSPVYTFEYIFTLPAKFLNFLGIKFHSIKVQNITSLFVWCALFVIKLYSDELRNFILKILE